MGEFRTLNSGERKVFDSGAQRDTNAGKGRYDLLPIHAIHRLAQLYERGAIKYADRNWEKGIPVKRMFDSALRHLFQALSGDQCEDHLAGAMWNIAGIIEYEERARLGIPGYKELFDDMGTLYEFQKGLEA